MGALRRGIPFLLLLAVGICAQLAFGTAQQGDVLTYKGKKYYIQTNPLERYLEQHPESRPSSEIISTSLWRGYVAYWEIKEGKLFLTDVKIQDSMKGPEEKRWRSVLDNMFPGKSEVYAEWFSGHIIVPTGKLAKYVHMGYASEYSSYWICWTKEGKIIKEWQGGRRAFNKFRKAQFKQFKKTEEYREAWLKTKNDPECADWSDQKIEEFLFGVYSEEIMSMMENAVR